MSDEIDKIQWITMVVESIPVAMKEMIKAGKPFAVTATSPMNFELGPTGDLRIDWIPLPPMHTMIHRLVLPREALETVKQAIELAQNTQETRDASPAKPRMH
jgi:hypothetical protein